MKKELAFIGAGKMGEVLLKGLLEAELLTPSQIIISDINFERLQYIKETYKVDVTSDNTEVAEKGKSVLLAVKPQNISGVLQEISPYLTSEKLLISIAAGISRKEILAQLGRPISLARVMPNAPALIGRGISALVIPPELNEADKIFVTNLFSSVGEVVLVDESLIDQVTAVSGSGPAYFFLFTKALTEAGVEMGIPEKISQKLASSTLAGAGEMLVKTGETTDNLIKMVASPGGTTEAALRVFEQAKINAIIKQAVFAALNRAKELGKG